MNEKVYIAGPEYKACAELERGASEFVLAMAGGTGAFACEFVVLTEKVQQVRAAQFDCLVCFAVFVDQERELDSSFFAEEASVVRVSQADRGKLRAFVPEGLLMFAQLRDVLTAKDSAPVAEENYHGRVLQPQRSKLRMASIYIGQGNCG